MPPALKSLNCQVFGWSSQFLPREFRSGALTSDYSSQGKCYTFQKSFGEQELRLTVVFCRVTTRTPIWERKPRSSSTQAVAATVGFHFVEREKGSQLFRCSRGEQPELSCVPFFRRALPSTLNSNGTYRSKKSFSMWKYRQLSRGHERMKWVSITTGKHLVPSESNTVIGRSSAGNH